MKCIHCGFESEQEAVFCAQCGNMQTAPVNTIAETVLSCVKDPLFLTLVILNTVSCGAALLCGSLPLLSVLATIFLWIVYAKGRKGIADAESLRSLSGTVFANYIITYVLVGLIVVCAFLFAALLSIIQNGGSLALDEIVNGLSIAEAEYIDLIESILSISGVTVMILFLIVAILVFLFNFFGFRKIHGFIKSVYQNVQSGITDVRFAKAAKNWLVVFAVLTGISVINSIGTDIVLALANGCHVAVLILSSVLIGKYFPE